MPNNLGDIHYSFMGSNFLSFRDMANATLYEPLTYDLFEFFLSVGVGATACKTATPIGATAQLFKRAFRPGRISAFV